MLVLRYYKNIITESIQDFQNALGDRPPIVLESGVRTIEYQVINHTADNFHRICEMSC
jgi:hypothetical protein